MASPFRYVVPAEFNTLKQKDGFLVFLQTVEIKSSWEATCMGTIPLKNRTEKTMEETAIKLEDAIFYFYFFCCFTLVVMSSL